jgi:hypothetical protein
MDTMLVHFFSEDDVSVFFALPLILSFEWELFLWDDVSELFRTFLFPVLESNKIK